MTHHLLRAALIKAADHDGIAGSRSKLQVLRVPFPFQHALYSLLPGRLANALELTALYTLVSVRSTVAPLASTIRIALPKNINLF